MSWKWDDMPWAWTMGFGPWALASFCEYGLFWALIEVFLESIICWCGASFQWNKFHVVWKICPRHLYQIKSKQLFIHKKNQAPSSYIKSFKHLNLKSKQTRKIQLALALLQPWNHKPRLDDCLCKQKQKIYKSKILKSLWLSQNHKNIKNRSQFFLRCAISRTLVDC